MDEYLYNGWLKIKQIIYKGKPYDKLEQYSAVAGLVLNQENKILLVKQYRPCIGKYSLEIPAGCLDIENESHIGALSRELQEEANIKTQEMKSYQPIMEYYSMLGCSEAKTYIFKVNVRKEAINKIIEDDDVEEVIWVSYLEFEKLILEKKILDNKTQRCYEYLKIERLSEK